MTIKALVMYACLAQLGRRDAAKTAALLGQVGEFAFVLIGFVALSRVIDPRLAAFLTAAVALSMALTPLAVVLCDRIAERLEGLRPGGRRRTSRSTPGRRTPSSRALAGSARSPAAFDRQRLFHRGAGFQHRAGGDPAPNSAGAWPTATPLGWTCCARPARPEPRCSLWPSTTATTPRAWWKSARAAFPNLEISGPRLGSSPRL